MVKRTRSSVSMRRRVRRRTTRKPRVPRGIPRVSIFSLKQKSYIECWQFSAASTAGFWRYIVARPNQLSGFADHAAVFDEYRINGVMIEFRPNYDGADMIDPVLAPLQNLGSTHFSIDPGSTLVPTGVFGQATLNTFFEQSQNTKTVKSDQILKMYYKPKVSSQVFGGGIAGKMSYAPWIKTSENLVEHRGVHVYIQPNNFTAASFQVSYDIYYTFYLQFRGNR